MAQEIDGGIFGVEEDPAWVGRYKWMPDQGLWRLTFLEWNGKDSSLYGEGKTHKDAFESLVSRWTILNGGESPLLRQRLPYLRKAFNDDGAIVIPD